MAERRAGKTCGTACDITCGGTQRLDASVDARVLARRRSRSAVARVGSGHRLTFCDGEKRLSEWRAKYASVT
jgi:hypothetical protein